MRPYIIFLVCFIYGHNLSAQDVPVLNKSNAEVFAKQAADSLKFFLQLTNKQAISFENLEREYLRKRIEISKEVASHERQRLIKELDSWHKSRLKLLLEPQQYKKFETILNEQIQKRKDKLQQFQKNIEDRIN